MMQQNSKSPIILTIEDEELIRKSFRYILEKANYRVLEAENGAEGLEIFKREKPDLLLVDLRMPEVDGLDVLREVSEKAPHTPVIIVSGTGSISDVIEALRLGAWDYLLKPITNMSVLNHVVEKNLDRARLMRENAQYQRNLEQSLDRIREDEEAGRKIQMKLLPKKSTTLGNYTLKRYFLPSQYLSGDFLDIFKIDDDHIAFYTADVSGHGVSSALITVLLKSFMRKHLEKHQNRTSNFILHPDKLMALFNNQLIEEDVDKHVTLFYGILSIAENKLVYTNAGQFPPPILWQAEEITLLESENTVAGLFPNATYCVRQKRLNNDFFLAIFSDGILEVLPHPSLQEKRAFLNTLNSCEAIESFIKTLDKNELPDDLTVVIVKRREPNG
jgi:phosphoserine phosphatase RsbU/P